jgi:hypothetical protein
VTPPAGTPKEVYRKATALEALVSIFSFHVGTAWLASQRLSLFNLLLLPWFCFMYYNCVAHTLVWCMHPLVMQVAYLYLTDPPRCVELVESLLSEPVVAQAAGSTALSGEPE